MPTFRTGNELIVEALREAKPDLVTVLPGFPLNQAQNAIIAGALGREVVVVNVASELDAVGIAIGAAQAGKRACAVIKDKGVNVAYQLIAEEAATPVVLIVGLDVDGRGSYVSSVHLPRVLEETGVINVIPRSLKELYEAVRGAFDEAFRSHRMVAVHVTEDLAMQGASSLDVDVIGAAPPPTPSPRVEDVREAVRALRLAESVAIVVGKGCLGLERVRHGMPAWPSVLGEGCMGEVWELAEELRRRGVKVELYCTKPASVFPETRGLKPTGANVGGVVRADVVLLLGVSFDMFAVKLDGDYVVSVNVDPLAASMTIADLPIMGDVKEALRMMISELRGGGR